MALFATRFAQFASLSLFLCTGGPAIAAEEPAARPLRALLIAGGCCHDYGSQQSVIAEGIQARANVRVDVYWTDNSTTTPVLPLYRKLNWAEDYDVIIHDECAADIKDEALVNRIVAIHRKVPAVHLHCAMHSFRTGTDAWFSHLGLQSSGHGPQEPIDIEFVDPDHPITATSQDWTTIGEELYNNVKVLGAHPLAIGTQRVGGNHPRTEQAIVAWTNDTQGARSFSTTIGHNTATVEDPRYLELVTRGLLWSCGKLNEEYLQPYQGENDTTFISKEKYQIPEATDLGNIPEDATLVKVTASTTQAGHPAYHAIDGKRATRFCADGGGFPQWLQLEFEEPHKFDQIQIVWEDKGAAYQYRMEGSADGKEWATLLDSSENDRSRQSAQSLAGADAMKFLRIVGLGGAAGKWFSVREIKLTAGGVGTLWPADVQAKADKFVPMAADRYQTRGNVPPRIEKLTPQAEAAILRDVRVPDGFTATVFASPPAVNYPVFVAADVNGTLYVSSDGNGSLGRNPERGRVIRLRDLDGDGRADETKVFCEIDAPRGLVWDHDRLYLMHPPNLSVFFDHDGDGVADEQKTLVKGLAFDYADRPADHTTNGLSLGADGWLYIAGGDFGFLEAEGSDGKKLVHRGGGVIRVRPDGSDLQIYSEGTRNILEVAISPDMEMFARDNTNDGGGWDVRLHHFTGMENHGYPRLYKNFNDECVQPLADYGGGSGCGAVYIDEPGFDKWNHAPFTADWGTGSLYRHTVTRDGATYQESAPPESFIKLTRPTDADVDGNSRVYCASWRGATFNWDGPDVGYIVCVRPDDFTPPPMPQFASASDDELIRVMDSPSYRRRIEAQRELMRRGNPAFEQVLTRAVAGRSPARNLLLRLQTDATDHECVSAITHEDPVVVHTAIRCLAARGAASVCLDALDASSSPAARDGLLRALAMMHTQEVVDGLIAKLTDADDELRLGIVSALCRLHSQEAVWKGDSWGTRPDTRGPYYEPVSWSESEKIANVLRTVLPELDPVVAADLVRRHYYLDKSIFDPGETMDAEAQPAAPIWSPEEVAVLQELIPKDAVKINEMKIDDAVAQAISMQGNVELGRYMFTKANCVACHTVSEDEVQKGPFLGSIAKTYKRPDLAVAIVQPSKTIAQGFVTNTILTLDGDVITGFVTNERSEQVTLRDQTGKETTIEKEEIDFRKTSDISVMPTGVLNEFTVYEFASLLDYLESLSPAAQ